MLTVKWVDQDGYERLAQAKRIVARPDGRQYATFAWEGSDDAEGESGVIDWPCTVFVMNDSGATVGKYVVIGPYQSPVTE